MKFANRTYKREITSCACADVWDFKQGGVNMFLLNIWEEHQSFVKNVKLSWGYKQYVDGMTIWMAEF